MPPRYAFRTVWRLESPLSPVWEAMLRGREWPSWWRGVERVTLVAAGDANELGSVTDHVWKSALPYRLRFRIAVTRVEPERVIEVGAVGELRGVGRMEFSHANRITDVRFDWTVETTQAWMNLLGPLLGPLFRWNHTYIMQAGAESLARRLAVRLIEVRHE